MRLHEDLVGLPMLGRDVNRPDLIYSSQLLCSKAMMLMSNPVGIAMAFYQGPSSLEGQRSPDL